MTDPTDRLAEIQDCVSMTLVVDKMDSILARDWSAAWYSVLKEDWEFVMGELKRAWTENERLVGLLPDEMFYCVECGFGVRVDEDGCCAGCGRDTVVRSVDEWLSPDD